MHFLLDHLGGQAVERRASDMALDLVGVDEHGGVALGVSAPADPLGLLVEDQLDDLAGAAVGALGGLLDRIRRRLGRLHLDRAVEQAKEEIGEIEFGEGVVGPSLPMLLGGHEGDDEALRHQQPRLDATGAEVGRRIRHPLRSHLTR